MMRVVAEGWWCNNCEFFEADNESDATGERCVQCGCYGGDHSPVEVVTKGYSQ